MLRFRNLLEQVSHDLDIEIIKANDFPEVEHVQLLDGTQTAFDNTTVYFGYISVLRTAWPAQCVVVKPENTDIVPPEAVKNIALIDAIDLFILFNRSLQVLECEDTQDFYRQMLNYAAKTGKVASVIELASSQFGNPLILLDTNYKVLASSNTFAIHDFLWVKNIRQGYCSYKYVSTVEQMDEIRNAPMTTDAFTVDCEVTGLRKLVSRIFYNSKCIGFLVMLEEEEPISPFHLQSLPLVSRVMSSVIPRYEPYLLPENTVYQKVLYDLLIGAPAKDLQGIFDRLQIPDRLCALCMKPVGEVGEGYLKVLVAPALAEAAPSIRFTFHERCLAAVVPYDKTNDDFEKTMVFLRDFAKKEQIHIGVSYPFSYLQDYSLYYEEAKRALILSKDLREDDLVSRYEDYAFYDLLREAKNQDTLGAFCHPALTILFQYDCENHTDLYRTLRSFLMNSCNAKETAADLFIHRNSLSYRLERIADLTGIDLNDSSTRFLLEVSYHIDHYRGRAVPEDTAVSRA